MARTTPRTESTSFTGDGDGRGSTLQHRTLLLGRPCCTRPGPGEAQQRVQEAGRNEGASSERAAITVTPDVIGSASLVAAPAQIETYLPEGAPFDQVMRHFAARIASLRADMDEVRQEMDERDRAIRQEIGEVHSEAQQGQAALRTRLSRMATDRVRVEMGGLIVAGIGSIVGVPG
jgi:hypothetical protein